MAGYHTELYRFDRAGRLVGVVGCAVGAPFAVLVAEQLFETGCEFLISVTSAGQIWEQGDPPYFVLIDRALRDEGTSHHYRHPERYAALDPGLREATVAACTGLEHRVYVGATWTTDAPFRETQSALDRAAADGILAVEMEAAALYTYAAVRNRPVVCFAHVTNQLGCTEEDFEKGEAAGSLAALSVIDAAIQGYDHATGD